MILFVFLMFFPFVLATICSIKFRAWESGMHMINADWMGTSEKFKFVARWGL